MQQSFTACQRYSKCYIIYYSNQYSKKKIKIRHEVYAIIVPLFLILYVDGSYLGEGLVFL